MFVKRLVLENYRCFDEADIEFDERVTVITGPNGSGKTAILDSLSIFLSLLNILSKKAGILINSFKEDDLKKGSKYDYIKYKIEFDLRSFECIVRSGYDGVLNVLHNDYMQLAQTIEKSQVVFPILVCYSSDRTFYPDDVRLKNDDYILDDKAAFKNGFLPKLDYISTLKWFKSLDIQEARHVRANKDLGFRLRELQAVKDVIVRMMNHRYDSPCLDDSGRELVLKDTLSDHYFRLSQLSHGFQSVLGLSIDLARRMAQANGNIYPESVLDSPAIVMIDEVDLHLHPSWQTCILPDLLEVFPKTQFIVTTQSSLVVASVPPRHVRILGPNRVGTVPFDLPWDDHSLILETVFGVPSRRTDKSL
ncbi:MAG: AAA family ATPase [Deltaproteobacteria bacterium]|jgi:predicted ATP-binding protein involved in virulence|nr:AAA family ATPase [Deltaproteobacteria bacterium]